MSSRFWLEPTARASAQTVRAIDRPGDVRGTLLPLFWLRNARKRRNSMGLRIDGCARTESGSGAQGDGAARRHVS